MRTSLVLLSLLALTGLIVGVSQIYSSERDAWLEETMNSSDSKRIATLSEWQQCRNKSNYMICDYIIGNDTALQQCYQAALDFASICYPNHANTTQECSDFWNFYATAEGSDDLPAEYFTCVEQGEPAAEESQFFYKRNFQVLWVNCAYKAI